MWAREPIGVQDSGPVDLVGREGIEPPQSKTADLQSAELTTCSTYPRRHVKGARVRRVGGDRRLLPLWSRRWDSNPGPAVYKTAALPVELRRPERMARTGPGREQK